MRPGEGAHAYVERLARAKASQPHEGVVLAADTSVVIDDEVLGKPGHDVALATRMLRAALGPRPRGPHRPGGARPPRAARARGERAGPAFRALSSSEIAWYVGTGEGVDKAGGYALQGRASAFITSVVGSPSNVIGLPLTDTIELLRAAGLRLPMDGP